MKFAQLVKWDDGKTFFVNPACVVYVEPLFAIEGCSRIYGIAMESGIPVKGNCAEVVAMLIEGGETTVAMELLGGKKGNEHEGKA